MSLAVCRVPLLFRFLFKEYLDIFTKNNLLPRFEIT
jgi:hypothetical protein